MLDENVKNQLVQVFSPLESEIGFVYLNNGHADQNDLLTLLGDVVETNPTKLKLIKSEIYPTQNNSPEFYISVNGKQTGVTFKGIPNGHEFTSLIVAILNADGKGKMADPLLKERIKSIHGPVHVKTVVSLTCENCPEVVQALNQMALIHPNFKHEMVDGGYYQDEINKLGIQGVPSVVVNNQMVHSGRSNLLDLIGKMEEVFGKSAGQLDPSMLNLGTFDVVVVGGGPAGASAAIYSVRKGLSTVLIADKIGGQVQETRGIENLISVVYTEGPQLAASLAKHLAHYPVKLLENRRLKSLKKSEGPGLHEIVLESGETLKAKQIIIATGAKWRELNVPGEKDYMGRGVAFCPHCDGPFYKDKNVAVIGGGNSGVEAAIDLAGIVKNVVLFEYNNELKADKILVDKLMSLPNIKVMTNAKTEKVLGNSEKVTGLEYTDRKTEQKNKIELDGIFVQIGLVPNSSFAKGVLELSKYGEIIVDEKGHTSVDGIYAAGDVTTTPYKQIIISMGEGAKTALAAFEDRMKSVAS
jgi:alkyl hydroperoxide reductase subunit F